MSRLKLPTVEQANSVIDEHLSMLANPDVPYSRCSSRTGMEDSLKRHGLIEDTRGLRLGESHALWYACLILTKRVREVSRLENAKKRKMGRTEFNGRTTENTIRRLLKGNLRTNHVATLLRNLLDAQEAQ